MLLYAIDGEVLIFFLLLLLSRERERERQIKRGDVFVGLHCTSRAGKQARKEGRKERACVIKGYRLVCFSSIKI